MLSVVLSRHGSTSRSDPEQHLGQGIDIALSESGRAAAHALAARLAGVTFDRIISSPLRRAHETAAIVADGRPVETDARLAEMDYGAWEGLTYGEIDARDLAYRRRWEADPASLACPGGESGADVAARVRSFLADAISHAGKGRQTGARRTDEGERILVVAHSTLNRVLLAVVLGVPLRDYRRRFRQDAANVTALLFPGSLDAGGQLLVANDTSHLPAHDDAAWRG